MWETQAPQYIYGAFNAYVGALPLRGRGFNSNFFYVFSKFFFFFTPVLLPFLCFCELSFQMTHQRLLTLRRLSVFWCVRFSILLFIVGLFGCFWGRPIRFSEGFWFAFLRFYHWWGVKPPGGIYFIFQGFCFHLRLMGLKFRFHREIQGWGAA